MSKEVTVTEPKEVTSPDFAAQAVEYLKSMGTNLPDAQMKQFVEMARAFQLNPFKREIYAVGYGDKWNIITGYEIYIKRAERTGKLDGWEVSYEGSGEDLSATLTVFRKDWSRPFKHTVFYTEAVQLNKDGKPNKVWDKMPRFMLKKCVIGQGFRLCFPDEFSGMPYVEEEVYAEEEPAQKKAPSASSGAFTKEQAQELADIMLSVYVDGSPVFDEKDKAAYREMLRKSAPDAIASARKLLTDRMESATKINTVKQIVQSPAIPEDIV